MARLYANETFPRPVAEELRRLGHDVLTTQEAGKSNQAILDEDVLSFAHVEGRAVLTLNRKHFIRLHTAQSRHSGIIVCTYDPDFIEQASRIDAAIAAHDRLADALLFYPKRDAQSAVNHELKRIGGKA